MFRILYVDDEPDLLEICKIFLEATTGFTVDTLTSAIDALAAFPQKQYDAIVSDYQMPEMDGIAFLKAIRSSGSTIPFILFTGRGREEVIIEALNNGADFYLQKGGDPKAQFAELSHKIRQAIQQRMAEENIRDHERRLIDILNFLPDATFAIDMNGVVIAWNRAIEEMTGVPASKMLGKGDYEYAIPFYHERRPILIDLVLKDDAVTGGKYPYFQRKGQTLFSEITIPHFDNDRGAVLWFTATPLYDTKERIAGAIESIRDITDRKHAEDELRAAHEQLVAAEEELRSQYDELVASEQRIRESEEKYRAIFETTGAATIIINKDTTIVLANTGFATLSGYPAEELAGNHRWTEFVVKEDLERMQTYHKDRRTDTHLAPRVYEFRFIDRAGTIRHCISNVTVIPGTILSVASIVDITERRKAEDELRAAYEQITASEEELKANLDELIRQGQSLRENEARLRYMLGFYDMVRQPEREILAYAVEGAGTVTGSPLGYLAFLNEDESEISMYAWSRTSMEECSLREKPLIYPVEKTGLWGEAVRQRKTIITNDYAAPNPKKKGYPDGHPQIVRHMNVPIFEGDHIVIVAGVANRPSEYTENEVRQLTLLMQELWQVLKRRRAEEELRAAHEQLTASEEELRGQFEELKAIQDELRQQQEQLNEVADMIPGVVYQFYARDDGMKGVNYVSRRAGDVFGFTGGTADFFPWFMAQVDEQDRPAFLSSIDEAVKTATPWNFEGKFQKPSGEQTWFQGMSRPVRHGNELVFNGILLDITDRKRADDELRAANEQLAASGEELRANLDELTRQEQRVRESERVLSTLMGNLPGIAYRCRNDEQWAMEFISEGCLDLTGYPASDLIGNATRSYSDCIHPDDRKYVWDTIQEAVRKQEKFQLLYRIHTKDGTGKWVWEKGAGVFSPDGQLLYLEGFITDINDRKRAEEALRMANKKLNLLSSITRHDIQNKVTIQLGLLALAQQKVRDSPEMAAFIGKLESATQAIRSQIEFTRTYQDLGTHEPQWQDLHQALAKNPAPPYVTVSSDCAGIEIFADVMLEKVFANFIDNAVRHGGNVTKICMTAQETGGNLIIRFMDNGAGIPVQEKEKIFERGYGKNTGLGLFLVREILSITGITICETGEPGKGVRFEMMVPEGAWRYADKKG